MRVTSGWLPRVKDKAITAGLQIEGKTLFRGSTVTCSCCGESFSKFAPRGTPNRICWNCGSRERHRALSLYFERHPELIVSGMRVLHVAPERSIAHHFKADPTIDYVTGDFEQRFATERVDVTDLQFGDKSFDAVLCNHVLEHVPDDRRAMREINRVLKPDGWAILLIPTLLRETTFEDPSITSPEERKRVFGQSDHVRIYGRDYVNRLSESGFDVEVFRPDYEWQAAEVATFRLRGPEGVDPIFICRPQRP